ncbi:FKBP-type peptidyl-prolyl cis-trans isomerase [Streptomyces canus]|uniref:FKBP-type peptidyl-prolyl cis-trans isomerase n=1 Tax=Streptomyces canus TaxID=58343 RepID=UPI002E32B3C0|nr:FKBP-type peptidyl-prolyl cis-trans isomerase [Streptomyces canus]
MRRIAVPLLTCALAVAGCSTEKTSSTADESHRPLPTTTISVSRPPLPPVVQTDAQLPKVAGNFGTKPTITVPKTAPSGKFVVAPTLTGNGPAVSNHDIAVINYTAHAWKAGKDLPSTYGKSGKASTPLVFTVGEGTVLPALDRAVHGQRVGSRILVIAPPAAAYGTSGNPGIGVAPTETVVFAVDIVDTVDARATVKGRQHDADEKLPSVRAESSTVSISVPDTGAPKKLASHRIIDGSGPSVRAGQTVVLRRAGAVWNTNRGKHEATLFDASWSTGPTPVVVGRGNLIKGLDRALLGVKVGSRLLIVLPPTLGYGSQDQKEIPARSTLVFVVDVLAAA